MNFRSTRVNMLTETDAAWLAGFIDGEGSIGLNSVRGRTLRTVIQVTNTNKNVLERIKSIVGTGYVGEKFKKAKENYKDAWKYYLGEVNDVESLLEQILPFLEVKIKQAELLLIYCSEHIPKALPTDIELEIYEDLKELNRRGVYT